MPASVMHLLCIYYASTMHLLATYSLFACAFSLGGRYVLFRKGLNSLMH